MSPKQSEDEDIQQRSRALTLRLTPAEFMVLSDAAYAARIPLAVFVREMLSGATPAPAPKPIRPGESLDQILAQLRGVATNLNQVAQVFNSSAAVRGAASPNLMPFLERLQATVTTLALEIKTRGEE